MIWQRPRPFSWQEQLNILKWIRDRNSLLLIEWDDHPKLFPVEIQKALKAIDMAPLRLCHALHTSSKILANSLKEIQPISYIIPNAIWRIPPLELGKHLDINGKLRIFIGNQNRKNEHRKLLKSLRQWCMEDDTIEIIIIGDKELARYLPSSSILEYPILKYKEYRELMRSCHISLLPLENSLPNNCKTPIKWMESAAESVAVIAGPGLYKEVIGKNTNGIYCNRIEDIVPKAKILQKDLKARLNIITSAHYNVLNHANLRCLLPSRIKLYESIWEERLKLDKLLIERLPEASTNKSFLE